MAHRNTFQVRNEYAALISASAGMAPDPRPAGNPSPASGYSRRYEGIAVRRLSALRAFPCRPRWTDAMRASADGHVVNRGERRLFRVDDLQLMQYGREQTVKNVLNYQSSEYDCGPTFPPRSCRQTAEKTVEYFI